MKDDLVADLARTGKGPFEATLAQDLMAARAELAAVRELAAVYRFEIGPGGPAGLGLDAAALDLVRWALDRARAGDALRAEVDSAPTADYLEAVKLEAAHQRERWGVEHDAGKRIEDWMALMVRLMGKLVESHWAGDRAKLLHHVVTGAAVLANMHANLIGRDARMRPGLAPGSGVLPPQPNEET